MSAKAVLMVSFVLVGLPPAGAQTLDTGISIMRPEPGVVNRYQSPNRLKQRAKPARVRPLELPRAYEPPSAIVVPETGRVLPNLPVTPQGVVPGGRAETFGDRALRCTQQSGLYGQAAGDPGAYTRMCVNQ